MDTIQIRKVYVAFIASGIKWSKDQVQSMFNILFTTSTKLDQLQQEDPEKLSKVQDEFSEMTEDEFIDWYRKNRQE